MSYSPSAIDTKNFNWFQSDNTCASLSSMQLVTGKMRGLYPFILEFMYPITAIAGENGSGKSTILAMAACGFHNGKSGYKPLGKDISYYTFSDFFVQSSSELPPSGIEIHYCISHNNWRGLPPGLGVQIRKKREKGKWNDYHTRVPRNVVYFGVQRVVPHYERSTHRSYSKRFSGGKISTGVRNKVAQIAGRVLGKSYTDYDSHRHFKYALPYASVSGVNYSGFNMGAGESAVFDILTTLFEAGRGSLLIIDEIELGLHERAQSRFIDELKQLCDELHCQILCSTHSRAILNALPPEGRHFIENNSGNTTISHGISADWACGKLAGRNTGELDIFVEDVVAEAVVREALPHALRERIRIIPIGSADGAMPQQLAARYRENRDHCTVIFDGDMRSNQAQHASKIKKFIGQRNFRSSEEGVDAWINTRMAYLPGETWPEKWFIETARSKTNKSILVSQWGLHDEHQLNGFFDQALTAGKHNEFYYLHEQTHQTPEQVRVDIIRFVKSQEVAAFESISDYVRGRLNGAS